MFVLMVRAAVSWCRILSWCGRPALSIARVASGPEVRVRSEVLQSRLQAGVILGLVVYNNMPGLDVPGAPSAPRSNGLTSCQPQVRDRKAIPACGFQEDQERAFGA